MEMQKGKSPRSGWKAGFAFSEPSLTSWKDATSLGSNANLYLDNTNSRLGVGTAATAQPLHVIGTGRFRDIASGPNNVIVNSNSSDDLGALNFTGNSTQFLLGNATWGTIGAGSVATICESPSANDKKESYSMYKNIK
jgi:hypothetical protein